MSSKLGLLLSTLCCLLVLQGCGSSEGETSEQQDNQAKVPPSIEIIAHRGDSYKNPENTMAAVESAWQKDADAVEVDVYLSADKRVVGIHDKTTDRTGDKDLSVMETSSEELRTVDVGSFKDEAFKGEKIPFLEEIVASVPKGKQLFIEIKDSERAVPYIKEIIEQSDKKEQMVIIAFDWEVVKASKEQLPEVPAYWLRSASRNAMGQYEPIDAELLQKVKDHNIDGLDIHFEGATPELVKASHEAGMKLYVWTVNEGKAMNRMAKMGVDGITTDRITRAKEVLK
ncbi:glycerophosphodiester phosphodiesterase [Fodinibius salsisoli]|uniref:Glycerophosphodiester phosphodiesterase n=1 Tax=Fodinibius salsisoli TaxID=2820877 RepID=A0ABT3PP96_9BACT|nr:glycerophosphodiester phosphodiesterase [Fodinibius salsisoli]MCW9707680.1 glycerophosphodiester phosphodiesterase [Fodinibius salsisoli]